MILKYSLLKTAGATQQQIDAVSKKFGISPEDLLKRANQFDPTKEKKFEAWVVKQMGFENIRLPEDGNRLKQVLEDFIKLSNKKQISKRDINQYPRIHDLEAEIDKVKGQEVTPDTSSKLNEYLALNGVRVFAQNNDWLILAVDDPGSASQLASGSKWCTSDPSTAEHYISEFWLLVIFKKMGNSLEKMYQATADLAQFMDIKDKRVQGIDSSLVRLIIDSYWKELANAGEDYSIQYEPHEGLFAFYKNALLFALQQKTPITPIERQYIVDKTHPGDVGDVIEKTGDHSFRSILLTSKFASCHYINLYFLDNYNHPRWPEFEQALVNKQLPKDSTDSNVVEANLAWEYVLNVQPFGLWRGGEDYFLDIEEATYPNTSTTVRWYNRMGKYLERNYMIESNKWVSFEDFLLECFQTSKSLKILSMLSSLAAHYYILMGDDNPWLEIEPYLSKYGKDDNMVPQIRLSSSPWNAYVLDKMNKEGFQKKHRKLNVV
ncbi:MAG: hypothetical protein WC511_02690 [Candidatus Pacearchaeota archaeon]